MSSVCDGSRVSLGVLESPGVREIPVAVRVYKYVPAGCRRRVKEVAQGCERGVVLSGCSACGLRS